MVVDFLKGYAILIVYFLVCASTALILRNFLHMPKEVFRKILHFILLGSIFIFVYAFNSWWISKISAIVFMVMVYPVLNYGESLLDYSDLLIERKKGEIKKSLIVVFTMFAFLIWICWGILGQKYLVIASVLAWGVGDAAAALVGKRFGRHFIEGRFVEGRKSLEGTIAMFVTSFITVLIVLFIYSPVNQQAFLPIALVTGGVSALVELYTRNGMDTLTCPLAAASCMIIFMFFLGV
ncbi:MAG: phosphatidate cytidylyltransferase [Tissierellia bacterium]|nr:phosphatidate cytidylyltransferase [Tissierellia bacterium]